MGELKDIAMRILGFGQPTTPLVAHNTNAIAHLQLSASSGGTKRRVLDTVPRSVYKTRQDIAKWKDAQNMALNVESTIAYPLQLLFDEVENDALLTSQKENRMQMLLGRPFALKKKGGEIDKEQTALLRSSRAVYNIIRWIKEADYRRVSLIEINYIKGILSADLVPRTNIEPMSGTFYHDYMDMASQNGIAYRTVAEYGTNILEFGDPTSLGLMNKAVPHVLFKRFAQSCWSELAEIYGIPPAVLKTNTQDPAALANAKKMMTDMGAAAKFIIDESESFDWADGVATNGDVYNNLMTFCNNEISLLFNGAIIGQDTKNGSRSKDESAQQVLDMLVNADAVSQEKLWNDVVIPALVRLGYLKGEVYLEFDKSEDVDKLWQRTKESLQYYNVDPVWAKEKFGIEITGERQAPQAVQQKLNFNIDPDFFA